MESQNDEDTEEMYIPSPLFRRNDGLDSLRKLSQISSFSIYSFATNIIMRACRVDVCECL